MILKVLCMDISKILKYKKILHQDNIDILNCKRVGDGDDCGRINIVNRILVRSITISIPLCFILHTFPLHKSLIFPSFKRILLSLPKILQ